MWSFIRYADRIIKEHEQLYMFLEDFIEDKVRNHYKLSKDFPTPDYEVVNVYKTDDNRIILEVDVYDYDLLTLTINNDEITEDNFFDFVEKHK